MKISIPIFLTGSLFLILAFGCKVNKPVVSVLQLSEKHTILFLDSTMAARAIIEDDAEGFFEKVRPLDMAIQMQQQLPEKPDREKLLAEYRLFLQRDVESFSDAEEALLRTAMERAYQDCRKVNPQLFPDTIRLIKTKGRHYGPSVYYTREDCIVIPENELTEGREGPVARVLIHEVFHILSRYNAPLRQSLYQMIGFSPLPLPAQVPDSLDRRILLNPDGVDWKYAIGLQLEGRPGEVEAVPIIVSRRPGFDPQQPAFFNYLDFQLYPVGIHEDFAHILTENGYRSPLPPPGRVEDFFRQIGDNTNYIIHPDEILADNYVLLALSKSGRAGFEISQYSERGQEVLREMEALIRIVESR